jgi:hypothetical protein
MKSRRLFVAMLGLALSFIGSSAVFAHEHHLMQAISETKEAIVAGKQVLPSSLVEHAVEAVDHARAAQKQHPGKHVAAGVKHLQKAIKTAKGTHSSHRVAIATRHAEAALAHLEEAR